MLKLVLNGQELDEKLRLSDLQIKKTQEDIKACRFVTDDHTQFIREYELKQRIFEN